MKTSHFLLAILFNCVSALIIPKHSLAQCSVKTDEDGTAKFAMPEKVYQNYGANNNGDMTRGWSVVYAGIFNVQHKTSTGVKYTWHIKLLATHGGPHPIIIPRRISFVFADGTDVEFDADTYTKEGKNDICYFTLDSNTISRLLEPVSKIYIVDTRQELGYTADENYGLYPSVLAEQIRCLRR